MRKIDDKHHVENDRIIKTSNGTEIPENEPCFLFRARDWLAIPVLLHYRQLCIKAGCNDYQVTAINSMLERFRKFAEENPHVMKQPGITRGL